MWKFSDLTASSVGGLALFGAQPLPPAADQRAVTQEPRVAVSFRCPLAAGPRLRRVDGDRLRAPLQGLDRLEIDVTAVSEGVLDLDVVLVFDRADRRLKQAAGRADALD